MGTNSRRREKDCLWTLYPEMFMYRGIKYHAFKCRGPSLVTELSSGAQSTQGKYRAGFPCLLSPSFVPRRVCHQRAAVSSNTTGLDLGLVTRPILRAVQGLLESGACACRGYGGLLPFYAFLGIKDS